MNPGTSLDGARPELLSALTALRAVVAQEHPGLEFTIANYGGMRTAADTALILQYRDIDFAAAVRADPTLPQRISIDDWRPIAPYGRSMHNYGAAFDVRVTKTPAGLSNLAALNIIKDYADVVGLVDGRDYGDPPEFALPGGLAAAKAAYQAMTGTTIFSSASAPNVVAILAVILFAALAYAVVIRGHHVRS